jgi:hypothetical protein
MNPHFPSFSYQRLLKNSILSTVRHGPWPGLLFQAHRAIHEVVPKLRGAMHMWDWSLILMGFWWVIWFNISLMIRNIFEWLSKDFQSTLSIWKLPTTKFAAELLHMSHSCLLARSQLKNDHVMCVPWVHRTARGSRPQCGQLDKWVGWRYGQFHWHLGAESW